MPAWSKASIGGAAVQTTNEKGQLRFLALPLPLGYSFTAEAAMKILIAMSFMYAFCFSRAAPELFLDELCRQKSDQTFAQYCATFGANRRLRADPKTRDRFRD